MADLLELFKTKNSPLIFFVNGEKVEDTGIDPRTSLAQYLRQNLKLTGTKIGCNEGGCGACTVMVSQMDTKHGSERSVHHYSVNACLYPIYMAHGRAVTTVEGIGNVFNNKLHPVQERLSKCHGSQCGFCTPGFVMAMYSLLRNKPQPSIAEIDETLQGNLCRCTGYRPILEAYYSFSKEGNNVTCSKSKSGICCKENGAGGCCQESSVDGEQQEKLTDHSKFTAYDPTQELIFPSELTHHDYLHQEFANGKGDFYWFRPTNLNDALQLKKLCPQAKIVAGNSEIGVEQRFKNMVYKYQIDLSAIKPLHHWELQEGGVFLGAALSLSSCQTILSVLKSTIKQEYKTRVIDSVMEMLHWFAGKHIRNTATIAGNIATASPISDLNPIWVACNARLTLASSRGQRTVPMDAHFFPKYRMTVIEQDEIIKGILVPFLNENDHFFCYKQAQRREDDIAIVNGAFKVSLHDNKINDITIAYGGMAPTTVMLNDQVSSNFKGMEWSESTLDAFLPVLLKEFSLPIGVPGGMERFRQSLVLSFFTKFFWDVRAEIEGHQGHLAFKNEPNTMNSTQVYQEVSAGQAADDPVGRPIMHLSGQKHTTGEAIYCDDISVADCLHLAPVLSRHASAKILNIDASNALMMAGVTAFMDHTHVTQCGINKFGLYGKETTVFAVDQVYWYGQPVGMIVAKNPEIALRAAQKVVVNYEVQQPVVTIEDAMVADKFYELDPLFVSNQRESTGKPIPINWNKHGKSISGSIRMGGQEHFYLETQSCIAVPGEDNEMKIISSTQHAGSVQHDVSAVLNIPEHKVVVTVRRIGGGFGGKETASSIVATMCAVAAYRLREPVRCTLERCDDMIMCGTRHPFLANYKVAFDKHAKITAFDSDLYSNAGAVIDLSGPVMERALCHIDNVYNIAHVESRGHVCRTNIQPNTAFRGFGGPQGMFITESVIESVAESIGMSPEQVREKNFYREGDVCTVGMVLENCNVQRCWNECKTLANFDKRRAEVDSYNQKHKSTKRGIAMVPTKFGIAFGIRFLNQAGALVHIYLDGTVLVSHGGMEMGQGLHTKVQQIACRALGVPLHMVHIQDASTDKVPNASATAASVGSDINGMAVKAACEKLVTRLQPYKDQNPNGKWVELVKAAYLNCVSLSATGYWSMPSVEKYDFGTGKGRPYLYFVYGVAGSEVEIDCLTGDHKVLQTDIVMDVGDSLNPAVDIGQIEGAFVQGYGLFTMEELKCSPSGVVYTRGPGTYKIPSADDIPRNFNVKLLKGSSNKHGVFSSKAIGEPPLFLGSSVFFAIKDAIKSARQDNGHGRLFQLDSPATPENIRLNCRDRIVDMIPSIPVDQSKKLWTNPL